jgi:membrane-bound lytic murein transglycosylase A
VAVTANRSIATDNDYYGFKGTLAFVKGVRPKEHQRAQAGRACLDVEFRPFSRFYLDQDIGGGVRGKARADLFFGEGAYAQLAAFNEDDRGDIYFLMLKK